MQILYNQLSHYTQVVQLETNSPLFFFFSGWFLQSSKVQMHLSVFWTFWCFICVMKKIFFFFFLALWMTTPWHHWQRRISMNWHSWTICEYILLVQVVEIMPQLLRKHSFFSLNLTLFFSFFFFNLECECKSLQQYFYAMAQAFLWLSIWTVKLLIYCFLYSQQDGTDH